MIWIVLAIIAAGYFIGDGIRRAAAAKITAAATIEQARLNQERELAERKQQVELEASPVYQKKVGLSLEFVEYLDEWYMHTSHLLNAQEALLSRSDLTKQQTDHYAKVIKQEEKERRELQRHWFTKWDKLERHLDPRHNLVTQNEEVSRKWEYCEKDREEQSKQHDRINKLKKEQPALAKKFAI